MNKEIYTGVLGDIQTEYNKEFPNSFNPENMTANWYLSQLEDYKFIDFTGDDGYGECCHTIFKWKGKYYKLSGFIHKSHYGTDWYGRSSSVTEVKPTQKTITVYE